MTAIEIERIQSAADRLADALRAAAVTPAATNNILDEDGAWIVGQARTLLAQAEEADAAIRALPVAAVAHPTVDAILAAVRGQIDRRVRDLRGALSDAGRL